MHKKAARNAVKRTNAERAFDIVNTVLMVLVALLCFYPIYFTVIASFSDPTSVVTGKVLLYPKRITLDSYKEILKYASILNGYKNTLIYTSCGTLYNLLLLIPAAYALSKKVLKGRRLLMACFIFTMYFNGGLIPYFLQLIHFRAIPIHLGQGAVIGIGIERLWTRHGWLVSQHWHSHDARQFDRCEEEAEVLKADPGIAEETLRRHKALERQYDADHGDIVKQRKREQRRDAQHQQLPAGLVPPYALFLHSD